MSLLHKILNKTGIAFLFETPLDDEKEVQNFVDNIEKFIVDIMQVIDNDITVKKESTSTLPFNARYTINDQQGERIELPPFSLVSLNRIRMSDSYQQLKSQLSEKELRLELREVNIDKNGIDTIEKLENQLDDFARYLVIQVSSLDSNPP